MSVMMWLGAVASGVIVGLAALWGRAVVRNARLERDQARAAQDVITAAGRRLDAARVANQAPVDPKHRDRFEQQP